MGIFNAILGNASEVNIGNIAQEFDPILIEGEKIEKAYKLIRDMFIFTNKRLILVEKQLVGTKVDYLSIPTVSGVEQKYQLPVENIVSSMGLS